MRLIFMLAPLLAACSQQPDEQSLQTGTFAGQARDRLCIAGEPGNYRAGVIAYGLTDTNCSATGRLEGTGASWSLIPKGEGPCRMGLEIHGDVVRISQIPASCSYYCGSGASLVGKSFTRDDAAAKAVDLAGDALC